MTYPRYSDTIPRCNDTTLTQWHPPRHHQHNDTTPNIMICHVYNVLIPTCVIYMATYVQSRTPVTYDWHSQWHVTFLYEHPHLWHLTGMVNNMSHLCMNTHICDMTDTVNDMSHLCTNTHICDIWLTQSMTCHINVQTPTFVTYHQHIRYKPPTL